MTFSGQLLVRLYRRMGLVLWDKKNISPTDPVGVQYRAYTLYRDTPDSLIYSFKTEFIWMLEKLWKTLKLVQ